MLEYLASWASSKSKIFSCKSLFVELSEKLGDEVKAQYIEIEGNGLLSRATLWETGNLVLEAIDIESEPYAISEIYELRDHAQLDGKLN
ncbi:hypothetical protein JF50_11340 [Pseudoalteromonas luteoviolacea]|uniref:Uncharacterized protein n=1 Tax=Pseudoalteromonas luteoviolacea TaxID=43657 RepID=A0A0C1Q760_9GAMM|nr:hypothetical protein [Pseudoalteromonas luteoviolacea]KID56531.1 hypothetical protein JF50_11340 [Pseudoalteromonas luteoviolacea]